MAAADLWNEKGPDADHSVVGSFFVHYIITEPISIALFSLAACRIILLIQRR